MAQEALIAVHPERSWAHELFGYLGRLGEVVGPFVVAQVGYDWPFQAKGAQIGQDNNCIPLQLYSLM